MATALTHACQWRWNLSLWFSLLPFWHLFPSLLCWQHRQWRKCTPNHNHILFHQCYTPNHTLSGWGFYIHIHVCLSYNTRMLHKCKKPRFLWTAKNILSGMWLHVYISDSTVTGHRERCVHTVRTCFQWMASNTRNMWLLNTHSFIHTCTCTHTHILCTTHTLE